MKIKLFGFQIEITKIDNRGFLVTFPITISTRALRYQDCEEYAARKAKLIVRAYKRKYKG